MITRQTRDEAYYWSSLGKEKRMKSELEKLRSKLAEKFTVGEPKKLFHTEIIPKPIQAPEPETQVGMLPTKNTGMASGDSTTFRGDEGQGLVSGVADKESMPAIGDSPQETQEPVSKKAPELVLVDNEIMPQVTHTVIDEGKSSVSEGQTKLGDFQLRSKQIDTGLKKKGQEQIRIIVDNREFTSVVVRELVKRDVYIEPKQLPVGDYIISERICVERKLVQDFLQSLIDGRLFAQLKNIKLEYQRPILILEGDDLFTSRKIHSSAIYGALVSIIADFNIPIISTATAKETAELIRSLAQREQLDEKRIPSIRGEKTAMSTSERQQFIIESLPNISATLAQRLLDHFRSVKAIVEADVDDLTNVKGIGRKTAEEIKKIINSDYAK
jgi:Fanconi anemia group M protein